MSTEQKEEARLIRTWPSSGKKGGVYELRMGGDGEVYCSCPGWKFSKDRPRVCKHIKAWVESVAKGGQNQKVG